MLRYWVHWVICLSFILGGEEGKLSASGWTCVGSDTSNGKVDSTPQEFFLTQGNITVRLESANPFLRLASEEVSIEGYSKAIKEGRSSTIHDIALRLLVIYDAMVESDEKKELGGILTTSAKDFAGYTISVFQRDYVLLWQSYVVCLRVRSTNDPLFISTAQKAFNLADAHEDEARGTFVVEFFLDKLTTQVGKFVAKKIIDSELRCAQDPRFLQSVVSQSNLSPPPPAYQEAVKTLQKTTSPSVFPPPYCEPE